MDEIMHTCPWFHATNIANCPPTNLVQLGIGGWQCPRPGVKHGRSMRTTILTMDDIEQVGIEKDHRDCAGGGLEGRERGVSIGGHRLRGCRLRAGYGLARARWLLAA